ncbi:MAG TPA: NUDIX domain-containing protein, partial [Gammaproteobacteria bacterium]|nr:NUDIX domain-containing protein [Gammaproteobacteria bacterium]
SGFFRLLNYRLRHRLFGGGWTPVISRELFERGHAAAVLPYDPDLDRVVLVEQFRIGALQAEGGPWLVECVAGMIEPGEAPEEVVRREALEEAGCRLQELERIFEYLVSPGGTSERITLYCGRVDASNAGGIHGLAEEHEDIRVMPVPFRAAMEMLHEGRIDSAAPIIAMQWLAMNRERLRHEWGRSG